MKILHITSPNQLEKILKVMKKSKHVFILIYMIGCGPCNQVRPIWENLEPTLSEQYRQNNNVAIIDVSSEFLPSLQQEIDIGTIEGFPTMKYISNNGNSRQVENYEDSNIRTKDRSLDSFIDWIESKILRGQVVSAEEGSPDEIRARIMPEAPVSRQPTKSKKSRSKSHLSTKIQQGGRRRHKRTTRKRRQRQRK